MKKIILIFLLSFSIGGYAQDDKTVTLVVSGQGKTQDEAKQNALRNAIEQAFGAFISSNTEILNDDLVKDEIVSVSNGNIQKFEIISEVQIPDGGYATTLKATVSVKKLTSFVESKGIVVEFKGSLLGANIKQQMLNEQNEIKSIGNMVGTCKEILDLSCDFSIVRGEPKQKNNDNNNWAVPIDINVKFNKNIEQFNQYLLSSIKGIAMSKDEVSQYNQLGKKTYKIALGNGNEFSGELRLTGPINKKFGRTQIDFIEKDLESKNSKYIIFQLVFPGNNELLFETANIEEIKEIIRTKYNNSSYYYDRRISIRYFDNQPNLIYHFRTISSVVSIIDLILYTKHSVLNFEINNGIDTITPEKLIADNEIPSWNRDKEKKKGYNFKVIKDNLTPIFNSRCNFYNFKNTSNGPNGIFGTYNGNGNTGCRKGPSSINLYEPFVKYSDNYYYNGGRNKSFENVYQIKYGFLTAADHDLPSDIIGKNYDKSNNGFQAVISLFDFKVDGNNVITFYYEDILTLADVEKVQEYRIIPVSKN